MRKSITAVTMFTIIALCSFTGFEKEYGTAACYEEGSSVVPMPNGGYLLSAAYNCGGGTQNWKSYLIHIDANGDTLWSQRDLGVHGKVLPTTSGDYLFYGGTKAGLAYDTIRISKSNATGQITWSRDIFMPLCKNSISDMVEVADGYLATGYYATGSCASPVYDGFVLKLDFNGNVLWNTLIEGIGNDQLNQIKATPDGGIAAFGFTTTETGNSNDYLLVKLNAQGQEEWRKRYGNELNNYGYGMEVLADGGYILTGYSTNMDVYRLDAEGNHVWFRQYGLACGGSYFKVSHTADNGLAFLGTEDINGQCTSVFIKTDMNGTMLYKKNWDARLREFRELTDGRFVLTGYASYMPNAVVILFDSLRFDTAIDTTVIEQPDTTTIEDTIIEEDSTIVEIEDSVIETSVDASDLETRYPSVKLYPNPSSGEVNIEFYNPNRQNYTLQVYTMNGMLVIADERIETDKVKIMGNTLAPGPYIYMLQGEGKMYMGKFIME